MIHGHRLLDIRNRPEVLELIERMSLRYWTYRKTPPTRASGGGCDRVPVWCSSRCRRCPPTWNRIRVIPHGHVSSAGQSISSASRQSCGRKLWCSPLESAYQGGRAPLNGGYFLKGGVCTFLRSRKQLEINFQADFTQLALFAFRNQNQRSEELES